jgi:hypothetical protein
MFSCHNLIEYAGQLLFFKKQNAENAQTVKMTPALHGQIFYPSGIFLKNQCTRFLFALDLSGHIPL